MFLTYAYLAEILNWCTRLIEAKISRHVKTSFSPKAPQENAKGERSVDFFCLQPVQSRQSQAIQGVFDGCRNWD